MGGDYGPQVVVEGAILAARNLGISSILVGQENEIKSILQKAGAESDRLLITQPASTVLTMEDPPSAVVRGKTDCSLRVAFDLVKEGKASAVVSPGNTGAMMAAGLYVFGTLQDIARPAIASLIPRVGQSPPTILLDSGANVDCHAYQLVQFALMGNCYAQSTINVARPRVALLSNGSEPSKGTDIIRSTALTLSELKDINFVGYVEGRDIARNIADVVVCDGFVGNIVLKAMEGSVELVFDSMRHYVEASVRGKLGLWLARPIFKQLFREKLDPSAYGGAPLLGLNNIAIVCHGSSTSRAIMNGVRVAKKYVDEDLISKMSASLSSLDPQIPGVYEDGLWNRVGQKFVKKGKRISGNDQSTGGES